MSNDMFPDEPAEGSSSLIMPFVVVRSVGGPYEDDSFTAGYVAGQIDTTLRYLQPIDGTVRYVVRNPLLPQLDLLAMRFGYVMTAEVWPEFPDDWSCATFEKSDAS